MISLPKGHVILETDAYQTDSVDDLPPSTFRSALLEKGFYQRGVSLLNGEGPWIDGLFYQLRTPQEASTLKTGKNLSWIFELMSAATENSRIENSIFNKIQSFTFILDRLTIGAFIVDADCRIIYQNNQSKLFQETDGSLSTSRSGKLVANDEATHIRMANIILTSCDTNNKERAMLTASLRISLPNLVGDLPDVASFSPLFFGADDHGIETAASLVLVAGKGCEVDNASKSLGLVAGLTRAEMAVLDMLLESKNASEIAKERNVSAQTVKSQIKSIYSKLRCKSQPEVQRLASLFSLPMQ